MGVAEEFLRLLSKIKGVASGRDLEPWSLARKPRKPVIGKRDGGGRPSLDHALRSSKEPSQFAVAQSRRPDADKASLDGRHESEPEIDEGTRQFRKDSVEASQDSIEAVRAGVVAMPGEALSSQTGPAESPGVLSEDEASGPSGSVEDTTVQPPPATNLTSSVDLGMTDHSITSSETPRNQDRRPGEVERQPIENPPGRGPDSLEVLQQLPAEMQRLQDRADTVEQTMNRALNQVIRTQEMLANQLARLDQKHRQSIQATAQVGQYLDQPGPSALNYGGC